MSKRFTDITKWDRPWFRKLRPEHKLLFVYVLDRCNRAGFWEIDLDRAAFETGLKDLAEGAFDNLKDCQVEAGYVYITDFIKFQYPKGLQADNRAHTGIIEILEKMADLGSWKGLMEHLEGCKDMEKDIEKERETEKAKEIARVFLERTEETGVKLLATLNTTWRNIGLLLKKGVTEGEMLEAIDYLTGPNMTKGKYKLIVLSGSAFKEKWDRIQAALRRHKEVPAAPVYDSDLPSGNDEKGERT